MTTSPSKPPNGLKQAGKRLWTRVVRDVEDGWELTEVELHLLERACRCEDEMRALEAAIDNDGAVVTGSRGQPVAHPALDRVAQLRALQLRLLGSIETADPVPARRVRPPAASANAAHARWGPVKGASRG